MDLNIFPSSSLFLVIFLLLFSVLLPKSVEAYYESYSNCTSFHCGKFKGIGYPFWGNGLPNYCGHPQFMLDCQEDDATIQIMSQNFSVLHIDVNTQILNIAKTDFLDNICHDQFVNTTLNFTLFDYTPNDENATLFYDCSQSMGLIPNNISCPTTSNDVRYGYFVNDTNLANELTKSCKVSVVVPILRDLFSNSSNISIILSMGFEVRWMVDQAPCGDCVESGGFCGYNWTLDEPSCFCPDHPTYNRSCPTPPVIPPTPPVSINSPSNHFNLALKMVIGAVAGGIGVLLMCIIICCTRSKTSSYRSIIFWRKKINDNRNLEAFIKNYGSLSPKRYSYSDIRKMTNSFRDKLGQGGYGCVYRGKLLDNCLVAVKLLDASKGNGEEFINEVASISRTSHVNVVTLLGFCLEGRKRALIYEFMPNGSLEKFIYGEGLSKTNGLLGWEKLYQVTIGIARGLEYLHRGCNQRILHFDIKPHNILLDEDFCPKVSDFGLAKLCTKKESIISMSEARGTIGYIAPEVFSRNFGGVSHKSDVYSYGMMVLEMVGGRKNADVGASHTSKIYFPHWVYKRLELDEELGFQGDMTEEENEMARKMIFVGLWCIQADPSQRPSMTKVLEMLEGSIEGQEIPPRPYLHSPSRSDADSSTT